MSIRRVAVIACSVFVGLVILAVCLSARFSLSNITGDFYAFVFRFLHEWSVALGAAGTIILAISVFAFVAENRRREEQEKQRVIHALHNEIHWNVVRILPLFARVGEWNWKGGETSRWQLPPKETLYRQIETRVFDDMRSQGQLHWLAGLRMNVVHCYSIIDQYNLERRFNPEHWKVLKELSEIGVELIRALESTFRFLPSYLYSAAALPAEKAAEETSHPGEQGKNNVLEESLSHQEPIEFKPLPWGVLFFGLWASLRSAVQNPSLEVHLVEWFLLGLSGVLLLAVLARPLYPALRRALTKCVPHLGSILTRRNVSWFFTVLVFFATLAGLLANTLMSWSKLQGVDLIVSVVGLACWMIAYLLVLVSITSRRSRVGQIISGMASAVLFLSAASTFGSSALVGGVLIGIGAVSIIIVITRPKSWDLAQMV